MKGERKDEREMLTTRRKVENYICYSHRPFTIRDIVQLTGDNEHTIGNYIWELKHKGKIKCVGKDGMYKLYVEIPVGERKKSNANDKFSSDEEYGQAIQHAYDTGIL